MNSYEFMQTMHAIMPEAERMFDATMALYEIMAQFQGAQVVNYEQTTAAIMRYHITGDPLLIDQMLCSLSGSFVTLYNHTYVVTITPEAESNIVICLQDTSPEVG